MDTEARQAGSTGCEQPHRKEGMKVQAGFNGSARRTAAQRPLGHESRGKPSFSHSPGSLLRNEDTSVLRDRRGHGDGLRLSGSPAAFLFLPTPAVSKRSAPRTAHPQTT